MGDKSLGVVVVGTSFGCRVHVPAMRTAGVDVVALVGRDRERLDRRANRFQIAARHLDLRDALKERHSDIVIIATPPSTHAELAEEVIDAGRHVLVEKPFTISAEDARGLCHMADNAGIVALVGHEFRFDSARIAVHREIRQGSLGVPQIVTVLGHFPLVTPPDVKMPRWWFDPHRGGGWLGASVSHLIDAMRTWLGEFETVSAALPTVSDRDHSIEAEDSVSIRFGLSSGCEGVLQESAGVWGEPYRLIRVAGPKGAVSIIGDNVDLSDSTGTRRLEHVPLLETPPIPEGGRGFTSRELGPACAQAMAFKDIVMGRVVRFEGVVPSVFRDGLACMQVIDAIRQSAREHGALVAL